ncbi:MAG: ATP-binding cassette domain-containing protein [Methylobacter sp.]|nr:MAG: ATP-binding cassette domain-containing protein [Methylobacter sp.]
MSISQQNLKRIEIIQLKGLRNLEMSFREKGITAILGPNGSGKSTILHALACINNPPASHDSLINHKLSEFFTPTIHSVWNDSSFDVYQDYRDGEKQINDHTTHFRKQAARWSPRYATRVERYISFIGIRTCVPMIEAENQRSRIQFNTAQLTDKVSTKIKELAGQVMNRNYTNYNSHTTPSKKKYIGVTTNNIDYSSLSMGAGEQRIFYILTEILNAKDYGLILIDEIDLLLHQDALARLLKIIDDYAQSKKLQIIFTTHSHSVLPLDYVDFRHLYQTPNKTLCFNQTKPDALHRLTGEKIRPIEIFVEDDLARYLVNKICSEEGVKQYVSIKEFGAAFNCFTAVSGCILNGLNNLENMLFTLDGDKYRNESEKIAAIKKVLTGSTDSHKENRALAVSKIEQFILPDNEKPEKYYHSLICSLDKDNLTAEQQEIIKVAEKIINPSDSHKFLDDIIREMDFNREVGLSKLVDLISLSDKWINVSTGIREWLILKKPLLVEPPH